MLSIIDGQIVSLPAPIPASNPSGGITLSDVKNDIAIADALTKKHSSGSDNQDLSNLVVKVTGSSLIADTEIAKIHASGSDNQDLSGLQPKESGKGLYPDVDASKLSGIEAGAEVNNISDANATDLTDTGATTLHKHSYNNLDDKPTIPDELADLSADATHRLVTDTEKSTWNAKQDALVSGTNIKTINSATILGSGNLVVTGSMPRGHIWGLTMSNAADTANDITIAAGEARDEAGTEDMTLASAITKRLDAGWSVGTNQGGLNTGSEANSTWYEVILIKRTDTGVVDVMFSTTANRTTLPASYTIYRRIGWIRNSAGDAILQFTQVDDYFTWTTQVNDASFTAATAAAAVTLTAPPNSIARFRATMQCTTSTNAAVVTVFSEIVENNVTPAASTGIASLGGMDLAANTAGHFELRVSSASTIEHDSDHTSTTIDISTFGFIDRRCRLSNI